MKKITYSDVADLRDEVQRWKDRAGGFTTGAVWITEALGERPVNPYAENGGDENKDNKAQDTGVAHIDAKNWKGPGFYVEFFGGEQEHYATEEEALLAFLEDHEISAMPEKDEE